MMSDNLGDDPLQRSLDRLDQPSRDSTWLSAAYLGTGSSGFHPSLPAGTPLPYESQRGFRTPSPEVEHVQGHDYTGDHTPLNHPPFYHHSSPSWTSRTGSSAYPMPIDHQVYDLSTEVGDSADMNASTLVEYLSTPPSRKSTLDDDKGVSHGYSINNTMSGPAGSSSIAPTPIRKHRTSQVDRELQRQRHMQEGNTQPENTGKQQTYLSNDRSFGSVTADIDRFGIVRGSALHPRYPQSIPDALLVNESFEGSEVDNEEWVDLKLDLQGYSEISPTG
ncbi:hypothetical protein QBC34DRAFT_129614 [Podospora aff. communis PSN243]|uniref:Uncharacterized protein n=1 Tax=Podospora aff. communis PSN243 TaxID=3040156 RepID=A0AAV9GH61_9PEZI|nr:hypothetical protein QBC34DRAFT_129614 [Podospora aff. communis PSN243]